MTFPVSAKPTLTANYSGSANFLASSSAAVTQVVTQLVLSTGSLAFANQLVGTTSAVQTVTLTNVGTTPLGFVGAVYPAPFTDSNNCPASLGAGRSCRVNVRFSPTTTGVFTGTLQINTTDAGVPSAPVALSGTGIQPAANLTPASHAFGTLARGTTSAPFAFALSNPGTAVLTINNISIAGTNPNQFTITSTTCGGTLAVNASCTINVAFAPTRANSFTANLRVADDAPNSPQTSTLTGTGQ
jgi:hypothetical protein